MPGLTMRSGAGGGCFRPFSLAAIASAGSTRSDDDIIIPRIRQLSIDINPGGARHLHPLLEGALGLLLDLGLSPRLSPPVAPHALGGPEPGRRRPARPF